MDESLRQQKEVYFMDAALKKMKELKIETSFFVFEMETIEREMNEPLFCNVRREGVVL